MLSISTYKVGYYRYYNLLCIVIAVSDSIRGSQVWQSERNKERRIGKNKVHTEKGERVAITIGYIYIYIHKGGKSWYKTKYSRAFSQYDTEQ